jgi:membrane associated rhomboid family serine protease
MRLYGRKYSPETQRWTQHQQIVLLTLIGANVAFFVAQLFLEAFQPGFVRDYLALSSRGIRSAYSWQFITAIFLHYGPWHLLGNMLVLYLLGRDLESILGSKHFFYLYLTGAFAGELGHIFLMPADCVLLAASGGVAAVLVAYATILPELELTATMFFILPIRLKAKHLASAAFAISVLLMCVDRTGLVIHSAYLGGCAAGWFYVHLLGFGRPWFWQRFLRQQRTETERHEQMSLDQLMTEEIDPLLEKISRHGLVSLSRNERRILFRAREKILRKTIAD